MSVHPAKTERDRERVTVYIDPDLALTLRRQKADTRVDISDIVQDILRDHYTPDSKARTRRVQPAGTN